MKRCPPEIQDKWAVALLDVAQCGFLHLHTLVSRAPGVWSATCTAHGWHAVAWELACRLGGQLWPSRRGVTWVYGAYTCLIYDDDDTRKIHDAQDILANLGIREEGLWTIGRCARALLKWATDPKKNTGGNAESLLEGIEVGYHDCRPGEYENVRLTDVEGYYYHLLRRMPSPRVTPGRRGLHWDRMTASEASRWREALDSVQDHKTLRNSLVGAGMGKRGWVRFYVQDKDRPGKAKRTGKEMQGGPFRAMGLLVVRSAWELCRIASEETGSVYSTIDSVCGPTEPTIWKQHGFQTETKAAGKAVIKRRGCWKIGPTATVPYNQGFHLENPVPLPPMPPVEYHRYWL